MEIIKTANELISVCRNVLNYPCIALDLETTNLDPYTAKLLLISFSTEDEDYVIDVSALGLEKLIIFSLMVLENTSIRKILHNAVFDYKILYHHGWYIQPVHCTMITEQILKAGIQHTFNLEYVTEQRLGESLNKDIRKEFMNNASLTLEDRHYQYAAKDTRVLLPIYHQQVREIQSHDLGAVYELEMSLIPVSARMEYTGILVDKEKLAAGIPASAEVEKSADAWIQDYVISNGLAEEIVVSRDGLQVINTRSQQQMLQLFRSCGINVTSIGKKELADWDAQHSGSSETEDDDFSVEYKHPLLRKHGIRVAAGKLQSSFFKGLYNAVHPGTGRIHPNFHQCGASSTGRYSSSGPNFQQIPNKKKLENLGLQEYDIRSCFIASPGCVFVSADYSGIELVILGAFSNDTNLITQQRGGDLHSFVASSLFNREVTKAGTKKDKAQLIMRDTAKTVTYAIMYGTTARNLYRTAAVPLSTVGIHITQQTAEQWLHIWKNELFPETGKFLEDSSASAVTKYFTRSALGRKRFWDKNIIQGNKWATLAAMREGSNAPIQSSSADMTKTAMVYLNQSIGDRGVIVASIHDEIVVECQEQYAEEVSNLVKQDMERAGKKIVGIASGGNQAVMDLIVISPVVGKHYDK